MSNLGNLLQPIMHLLLNMYDGGRSWNRFPNYQTVLPPSQLAQAAHLRGTSSRLSCPNWPDQGRSPHGILMVEITPPPLLGFCLNEAIQLPPFQGRLDCRCLHQILTRNPLSCLLCFFNFCTKLIVQLVRGSFVTQKGQINVVGCLRRNLILSDYYVSDIMGSWQLFSFFLSNV